MTYIPRRAQALLGMGYDSIIKKINLFKTHNNYKSNLSNYEGKTCVVEEVLPNNIYRIKIFSEIWTAKSDEILLKGDVCKVSGRLDNTLIIKKQQEVI